MRVVAAVLVTASVVHAAPPFFHEDPDHPWNRLHEVFWIRHDTDGSSYGYDRLDPLLWRKSRHLLEGPSHDGAVLALEDFLSGNADTLIRAPLKRAVMQRDMWVIFDHTVGHADTLSLLLAQLIKRLALPAHVIRELPDNYSQAVASGGFPSDFGPDAPDRAFLPAELLAEDGPWVCLGRPEGLLAPAHTTFFARSYFAAFISLPGGRGETIAYLASLAHHARRTERTPSDAEGSILELPQVPMQTRVALVRRALLVDDRGVPTPSPLTTQVQLRVLDGHPVEGRLEWAVRAQADTAYGQRAFFEFRLRRSTLFAGVGLWEVGAEDAEIQGVFRAHGWDWFEVTDNPVSKYQFRILKQCRGCHHGRPGIFSVNTVFPFRHHFIGREPAEITVLTEGSLGREAELAIQALKGRLAWSALMELWGP